MQAVIYHAFSIRNLGSKDEKFAYISKLSPNIQQFLGANVEKVGIGPEIFNEITIGYPSSSLEYLINAFDIASKIGSSTEKRTILRGITLTETEKEFVGKALYAIGGNIGLGVTLQRADTGIENIISPMLAKSKEFDPSEYQIEPKLDGYRLVARKVDGEVILHSRNGKPLVSERITRELTRCLPEGSVVDGEILAMDGNFESLRRHGNDVQYQVFDCLYADGQDIMNQPLVLRRLRLEGLELDGRVSIPEILDVSTLDEVDAWIRETGAEGVIAKDPSAVYKPKNRGWIKRKLMNDLNARIVGMTAGTGKRKGMLGALEVIPEGLTEITKVGTGFSDDELLDITCRLQSSLQNTEQLRCVVRYQDITKKGVLRFPVFVRLL